MPMMAGPASPADRATPAGPKMQPTTMMVQDAIDKDAILSWFRGEFAAANAIIDALCSQLAKLSTDTGGPGYDSIFAAIHRRRINWIPVLQMQTYHSIAEVVTELRRVGEKKAENEKKTEEMKGFSIDSGNIHEKSTESTGNAADDQEDDSPDREIIDSGSQEMRVTPVNISLCSNHEECEARRSQIKLSIGFIAKGSVKGHMVNVVKGLKLYEDIFTDSELSKLTQLVSQLHAAGQNGELSGETFILFNKQIKGNKRELIQLGVPIFGQIKEETKSHIEPIPVLLQGVIDHLVQWQLIPEYKRPNGCIINFFEEGEYSQPFLKPPHLDQPISTLFLAESTVAFGRSLVCDNKGNYKGPLMLSLKQGSLLVMRGNSAEMARHVMCPSPNRRVSITFFRVRPDSSLSQSPTLPMTSTTTLWGPGISSQYAMPNGALPSFEPINMTPKWGILGAPMLMLTPAPSIMLSPRKQLPDGGTGVFLPWNVASRKSRKHLAPRVQKGRLLVFPSPVETHMAEFGSESRTGVEGKEV